MLMMLAKMPITSHNTMNISRKSQSLKTVDREERRQRRRLVRLQNAKFTNPWPTYSWSKSHLKERSKSSNVTFHRDLISPAWPPSSSSIDVDCRYYPGLTSKKLYSLLSGTSSTRLSRSIYSSLATTIIWTARSLIVNGAS